MNMRERFSEKRKKFYGLYTWIMQKHDDLGKAGKGHRGHGPDHDIMVAQYCLLIAEDEVVAEMAWCASLLHSFDRMFGDQAEEMIILGMDFLYGKFDHDQRQIILKAVLDHSKPNATEDSDVTVVLKDADKLANVVSTVIARSGQFYNDIPVIELGFTNGMGCHPKSTYSAPRSCRDDIVSAMGWENDLKFGLRLSKSKELGKPKFDFLRGYFQQIEASFREVGLDQWPIPET